MSLVFSIQDAKLLIARCRLKLLACLTDSK